MTIPSIKIVFGRVCLYCRHFVCNLLCNSHLITKMITKFTHSFNYKDEPFVLPLFFIYFFFKPWNFLCNPLCNSSYMLIGTKAGFLPNYQSFLPALYCSFFPVFLLLLSQPWGNADIPYHDSALESSPILTWSLTLKCSWYHRGFSQRENVIFHQEQEKRLQLH